jgi:hypothetical protein
MLSIMPGIEFPSMRTIRSTVCAVLGVLEKHRELMAQNAEVRLSAASRRSILRELDGGFDSR